MVCYLHLTHRLVFLRHHVLMAILYLATLW